MSVECLFSITPLSGLENQHLNWDWSMTHLQDGCSIRRAEGEEENQRRFSACSQEPTHTDVQRGRRRFNVGRVLVLNTPLIQSCKGGGRDSTSVQCLFSATP
jgi:hypothetical protein